MRPRLRHTGPAALVLLTVAYAIQAATPLRLTGDSVLYLSMAHSLATGHGIPAGAVFPPGLPGLYAVLDAVGANRSWAIVLLNVAAAVLAVGCTIFLYRRVLGIGPRASMLLGCCALLSYVLVKHAALAMSDVPFLGCASAALALLTLAARGRSPRRWWALAGGAALVAAAITIRSAGIALVPAALVAAAQAATRGEPAARRLRTRRTALALTMFAAACVALGVVLAGSRYVGNFSEGYGIHQGRFGSVLGAHLRNWGELAVNVPETRLPAALHPLLLPVGVLVTALLLVGLWRVRPWLEPVHAFAVSYLVLIFVWPFDDARFWLPLVPVAIGFLFVAVHPLLRVRAGAVALGLYAAVFALLGVAALAYDTRLSYSGASFPDRFGSDVAGVTLRPTYRVAFGEARRGDAALVKRQALAVLRHWEARASSAR